jgi:UDP-N-acetyl-D-glucosamine dehydrogenase
MAISNSVPVAAGRNFAPSDLAADIEAANLVCAVIGLGFIGSLSLRAVISAGFRAVGFDRSRDAVERFRMCADPGSCVVSDDPAVLASADVVIVAVRGKSAQGLGYDAEPLRAVAAELSRFDSARGVRLCLIESTVPPGVTRRLATEWLAGPATRHLVAHCPERVRVGDSETAIAAMPRLVGGVEPEATDLATKFLRRLGHDPHPVSSPEISELSKLLENAFLTTGIALVADVTQVAHRLGVSADEVAAAAATKPNGYFPFHPGPGVGGHCLASDLDILRAAASDLGESTPVLDGVARRVAEMPAVTIRRLETALGWAGRPLRGSRIAIVGVGFKIGSPDLSETPAREIIRRLRHAGASVCYVDHQVPEFDVDGVPVPRVASTEVRTERLSAALILSGDASVHFDALREATSAILDTGGGRIMRGGRPAWTL